MPSRMTKQRACDACHRRKIHCDRAATQCDWCKHHGLACTYDRPLRRPGPHKEYPTRPIEVSDNDELIAAAPRRESAEAGVEGGGTAPNSDSRLTGANVRGQYFAGSHLWGASSFIGIPFFSDEGEGWIRARSGSNSAFRALCARGPPWQRKMQSGRPSAPANDSFQLLNRSTVEHYFSVFRKSALQLVFPIVDVSSFASTIDRAFDVGEAAQSPTAYRAKACVLSFLAIVVLIEGTIESTQTVESEQCAAEAHRLMPYILLEADRESLQVCVMQCMYNLFLGNTEVAALYHSIACRHVMLLGAHLKFSRVQDASVRESPSTGDYYRRVFWQCYMYDKDISIRTGLPPIIDDDHCDLTLPPDYKNIDGFDNFKDDGDLFPGDVRLSIIKSKAIRLLYSDSALSKSEAELLRAIRNIDDELERWRLTIPLAYRPSLSAQYRILVDPAASKPKKVHIVVIHLEYFSLVALIHSASGRCHAWASDQFDQMTSVTSSQALALQASRSILRNLSSVSDTLDHGDFWIFIFYPISASITIFCNILLSPLNAEASADIRLLEIVPDLVRAMFTGRLALGELVHLKLIQDFVEELTRLAQNANSQTCWNRQRQGVCPLLSKPYDGSGAAKPDGGLCSA